MPPLWISEADVAACLTLPGAIDALERALVLEASGAAINMVKTHAAWGAGHTLHAIGAVFPASGFAGTKTWAHTSGGAAPLFILFDSNSGAVLAIIEAFHLGQLRTGGMSGVATRALAEPGADQMAIVGTGKQALMQVAAVNAVRPLKRVHVFSPTADHRRRFALALERELHLQAVVADSVAEAVSHVPIVTVATRAREPFLVAAMLARGTHINAIGAITPERTELAPDVLLRCTQIVADSIPAAQKLSRELVDHFNSGAREWHTARPLCQVVAAQQRRAADADLTLFKALGMGIADLALAVEVYAKGRA
ncbi:MAG: ornithine cyclodeaminase family protein [Deltaproteobacteria bacterium]|nr:ornithine cyclodeaminase family protein [Deltaproteobacteria bacterium]